MNQKQRKRALRKAQNKDKEARFRLKMLELSRQGLEEKARINYERSRKIVPQSQYSWLRPLYAAASAAAITLVSLLPGCRGEKPARYESNPRETTVEEKPKPVVSRLIDIAPPVDDSEIHKLARMVADTPNSDYSSMDAAVPYIKDGADTNGDGKVTAKEFEAFVKANQWIVDDYNKSKGKSQPQEEPAKPEEPSKPKDILDYTPEELEEELKELEKVREELEEIAAGIWADSETRRSDRDMEDMTDTMGRTMDLLFSWEKPETKQRPDIEYPVKIKVVRQAHQSPFKTDNPIEEYVETVQEEIAQYLSNEYEKRQETLDVFFEACTEKGAEYLNKIAEKQRKGIELDKNEQRTLDDFLRNHEPSWQLVLDGKVRVKGAEDELYNRSAMRITKHINDQDKPEKREGYSFLTDEEWEDFQRIERELEEYRKTDPFWQKVKQKTQEKLGEEFKRKVLERRENYAVAFIARTAENNEVYLVFGGAHDFGNNEEEWNAENPNKRVDVEVFTPESYIRGE
jgi:hypothetical protein